MQTQQSARNLAWIPCKISRGMFPNERAVRLTLPDGETLSLFADASQVRVGHEPGPGEEVDGLVRVAIVAKDDSFLLVDLPQETFTKGPRISVPNDFVRTAA